MGAARMKGDTARRRSNSDRRSAGAWWRCQLDSHRSIGLSLTSKRRSFYYLLSILLFLSPLCAALVGLHFALQLLIWFEIVEANHLITA